MAHAVFTPRRAAWLAAAFICLLLRPARAEELAAALYVRTDTDATTVVSPHVRGQARLQEGTALDVTYAADVWTSASIDIRASASVLPVTEQRDELDVAVSHELGDLTLSGSYRFSTENDYTSHGLTTALSYAFANNAATLDFSLTGLADSVGRSGDPTFSRGLSTLDTRVAFTQVLDPQMFAQLTYELAHNNGYQSSPYRFVGLGGTGFGCVDAALCLQEHVPWDRTRHALALLVRRALSEEVSAGLTYRFYTDDWGLGSHTLIADVGWQLEEHWLLFAGYRFYTQGSVDFYKAVYPVTTRPTAYTTRDRELSPLVANRVSAQLERAFPIEAAEVELSATLGVAGNFYTYDDFVGLSSVSALEVTIALLMSF